MLFQNLNPHKVWWQQGWKVARQTHSFSLSYLCRSECFFILSLHHLSFFFFPFSWLLTHKHTHVRGCWSRPPLRSSNMQVGSWMIKAVAGGLHFETINRPPGAESNSKPSISVNPGSRWHRGRGHAEGERAGSTSASSSSTEVRCWKIVKQLRRDSWHSDVISSRLCGFIQLTLQPLTRGGWEESRESSLLHFLFP